MKGPTRKLDLMSSLRGTGVEYFCKNAVACLKLTTNTISCRSSGSGNVPHWGDGSSVRRTLIMFLS
jgi:hypothetical protein